MGTAILDRNQDSMHGCRSLSSNRNPIGPHPKISIGVMVEKTPKAVSINMQEEPSWLHLRRQSSFCEKSMPNSEKSEKKISAREEDSAYKQKSPWVSTRAKNDADRGTNIIHSFENRPSKLQAGDGECMEPNKIYCESPKENVRTVDNEVRVDQKVTVAKSEALKRKLWEALGTDPSENKKIFSSQTTRGNVNHLIDAHIGDGDGGEKAKLKLSDTIETDSEIPIKEVSRLATRSVVQRKQRTRCPLSALKTKQTDFQKQKSPSIPKGSRRMGEKKAFSFDEQERMGTSKASTNSRSNCGAPKVSPVEPRRLSFSKSESSKRVHTIQRKYAPSHCAKLMAEDNTAANEKQLPRVDPSGVIVPGTAVRRIFPAEQTTNLPKPEPALVNTAAVSSHKDSSFGGTLHSNEVKKLNVKQNTIDNLNPQMESHQCPCNAPLQGQTNPINKSDPSPSSDNSVLNQRIYPSPLTSSDKNDEFCSLQKSVNTLQSNSTVPSMPSGNSEDIFLRDEEIKRTSSRTKWPKTACDIKGFSEESSSQILDSPIQDANTEYSMSTGDSRELPTGGTQDRSNDWNFTEKFQMSGMKEPCEETRGFRKNIQMSWLNEPIKEKYKVNDANGKETEEANRSPETAEQLPEDTFLRAIAQVAMIFRQIKAKIKVHANEKNSKILSSVKDKIQMQLSDIESQIQADMRKFTSLTKSKRKYLESTLHAQHENLKAIHKKFKEEVSQHLLECKETIEELEAFQMESKGTRERQRLHHRKVLMQMKESIGLELSEAERRVVAIQKVAKKKMNGLKHVLSELLDEGAVCRQS